MKPVLLAVVLFAGTLSAGDSDFDRTVADLEDHLGKRRLRIPFLGVATFLAGAARPVGVHAFKLAVIEDVDGRDARGFEPRLRDGWRPVIRVKENRGRSMTTIYGRDEGNWVRMLMMTVNHDDAVVMQFRVRYSRFLQLIADKARGD